MSKGSQRRPMQCLQEQYDRNWLRLFGVECPKCGGEGIANYGGVCGAAMEIAGIPDDKCTLCNGYGKVEKRIVEKYKNENS